MRILQLHLALVGLSLCQDAFCQDFLVLFEDEIFVFRLLGQPLFDGAGNFRQRLISINRLLFLALERVVVANHVQLFKQLPLQARTSSVV